MIKKLSEHETRRTDDEEISNAMNIEMSDELHKLKIMVREDIRKRFPDLFGDRIINGCKLNVEETIGVLYNDLHADIARALSERMRILGSNVPVSEKYATPNWEDIFQDPVSGQVLSFRQVVQGLIDNFLGRKTELVWRLNDEAPIPNDAHPLTNPGLELTGPWNPLDMAIKQINADVAAVMGPDDEDAAPPDYVPIGTSESLPVGLFVSRSNERKLLAGEIKETSVTKKGETKTYRINKRRDEWPTSFHRVPGIHLLTPHVTVNGNQAPAIIVDFVIHALNDQNTLKNAGSGLYYYQPKIQNPAEALIVAKLVWKLERLMGAKKPGTYIKFKALFEEGNLGRFLPVVMWIWRYWLIGTNVGRWDYTGSLIEIWKDEYVLPDPQNSSLMGMTSPHMMAYQRYNALINLMAGMKNGKLTNGAPIGGMAAVMLYPDTDPYGRNRHNPVTLRAMKMDKLRERLIGLIFVPDVPQGKDREVTLSDIMEKRVNGALFDAYRQSWVATPDKEYVAAGNSSLRTPLTGLQSMLDAPEEWEGINGEKVAPRVASGLTQDERNQLMHLHLLNDKGQITPWVISRDEIDEPWKFYSEKLWPKKGLWRSLYEIPKGEVTAENIQHAFYMCANYGFQVLNGNLAAAIDDYKIVPDRVVRFMNDLATYRIFAGWLWTVMNRRAKITKDGFLKKPKLTNDGVIPGNNEIKMEAGTTFTPELFEQLWRLHGDWTRSFFEDYDRLSAIRIIASVIVDNRKGKDFPKSNREHLTERIIQRLASLSSDAISKEDISSQIATMLNVDPSEIREDIKLFDRIRILTQILSKVYGSGEAYLKLSPYEEAAELVSKSLGIERSLALEEIKAAAPRFDRSKAPVIMDLLRRQLLSSRYIQHSPRVLFVIADKVKEKQNHILNAIYFVDEKGKPLFRDDTGQPSREKLLEAVGSQKIPHYALEAHDYVYDIFSNRTISSK